MFTGQRLGFRFLLIVTISSALFAACSADTVGKPTLATSGGGGSGAASGGLGSTGGRNSTSVTPGGSGGVQAVTTLGGSGGTGASGGARLVLDFSVGGSAFGPQQCNPKLVGIVRDFNSSGSPINPHPDFESFLGAGIVPLLVSPVLGVDATPSYADVQPAGAPMLSTSNSFRLWFSTAHPAAAAAQLDLDNPPPSAQITKTVDTTTGATTYDTANFFPMDGSGTQAQDLVYTDAANGGVAHNYHFTFELHMNFKFIRGQILSFQGNDDLWVFIDKKLAIDVGGVHPPATGAVALDTLGLTPGVEYQLSLFYAQRHTPSSKFKLVTNIAFTNCSPILR